MVFIHVYPFTTRAVSRVPCWPCFDPFPFPLSCPVWFPVPSPVPSLPSPCRLPVFFAAVKVFRALFAFEINTNSSLITLILSITSCCETRLYISWTSRTRFSRMLGNASSKHNTLSFVFFQQLEPCIWRAHIPLLHPDRSDSDEKYRCSRNKWPLERSRVSSPS